MVDLSSNFNTLNNYFIKRLPGQEQLIRAVLTSIKLRDICSAGTYFKNNPTCQPKMHMLVRGPSGCGKSHSLNLICNELNIPFVSINATDFTSSGYVGSSLTDILRMLVEASKNILKKEAEQKAVKVERDVNKNDNDDPTKSITNHRSAKAWYKKCFKELKSRGVNLEPLTTNYGNLYATPVIKSWKVTVNTIRSISAGKDVKIPENLTNVINVEKVKNSNRAEIEKYLKALLTPIKNEPNLFTDTLDHLINFNSARNLSRGNNDSELNIAETKGVVLIDEFDKIFMSNGGSYNVGTTGIIREILAYLSGSNIPLVSSEGIGTTKSFNTAGVLFICAGAFDMVEHTNIPTEILGRLAIRVKMEHPNKDTFFKLLTTPETGMLNLLEGVLVEKGFTGKFKLTDELAIYFATRMEKDEKDKPIGVRRLTAVLNLIASNVFWEENIEKIKNFTLSKDLIDHYADKIQLSLTDFK